MSLLRPGISVANVAESGLPEKLPTGGISTERMKHLEKEIKPFLSVDALAPWLKDEN